MALSSLSVAPDREPLNDETIETSVATAATVVGEREGGPEPLLLREQQISLETSRLPSLVTFAEPSFCLASVYEYLATPEVTSAYFR